MVKGLNKYLLSEYKNEVGYGIIKLLKSIQEGLTYMRRSL